MDIGMELRGQDLNLQRLAVAPVADGVRLACSDSNGTVQLWDPHSGVPVTEPVNVETPTAWDMCVVDLGAGRHALAACGTNSVSLWDLASFTPGAHPIGGYDVSRAMAMGSTPATRTDPAFLVTAEENLVRIADPRDGTTVNRIRLGSPGPQPTAGHRAYGPTGVRFGDGTAGFAVGFQGELQVWRLSGGRLTSRAVGLGTSFRSVMAYLGISGGNALLAVAVARGIEVWDLDAGRRVVRGEVNLPIDVLAPIPVGGRTLVAAAFHAEGSGVLLWDPATGEPASEVFNRPGPAWGNADSPDAETRSVVALPGPDGTVRIASTGNDGIIRLSPPVEDLLTGGSGVPASGSSSGGRGGNHDTADHRNCGS